MIRSFYRESNTGPKLLIEYPDQELDDTSVRRTQERHRRRWKRQLAPGNKSSETYVPANPDPQFVVINTAVFLDDKMMEKLGTHREDRVHYANYVMLVFSAVNKVHLIT